MPRDRHRRLDPEAVCVTLHPNASTFEMLVGDTRVHSAIYTSPEVFSAEVAAVFEAGWVYLAHESQLCDEGSYVTARLGRHPVIVCRDSHGEINVLMNRCTHRGTLLCDQPSGVAREFRCPYHSWTFDLGGRLRGVPYLDGYQDSLTLEAYNLPVAPRLGVYRGFVFASLASSGTSLDEHLGPHVKREIDWMLGLSPTGTLRAAGTLVAEYRGNWKLQMENTTDAYHVNFLHASFNALSPSAHRRFHAIAHGGASRGQNIYLGMGHSLMDIRPVYTGQEHRLDPLLEADTPEGEYVRSLVSVHGRPRAWALLTSGGTHLSVWPNLALVGTIARRLEPLEVDQTRVELTVLVPEGMPEEVANRTMRQAEQFFPPAGLAGTEDLEVFERQQRGMANECSPWLSFERGAHREEVLRDGRVIGQITDECGIRGAYSHWRSVMAGLARNGVSER